MDSTFELVQSDDSFFNVKGKQVFLIRYPKECDISSFDGVNLDLHNGDSIKKESGEKMFSLKMEKGAAGCKSTMRAIVNDNESEGNRCIGPDFDGSLVITRSFDIPKSIVGQIEKRDSYEKLSQLTGLTVQNVPFGSNTELASIQESHVQVPVSAAPEKKKKKRHSVEVEDDKDQAKDKESSKKKKHKKSDKQ